jgi:hypothetical protein
MIATARFWLALLVVSLIAYGGGRWQQSHSEAVKYEGEKTKAALSAAADQIKATDLARAEEQRRAVAQTEIANAAKKDAEEARLDARTADAAADGLRKRINELLAAARASQDSAATSGSASAGDPLGVLADVLEKSDRRAGIVAEYADSARIAGQACERAYDALTPAR